MDDESGESMEPMGKVPLVGLGEAELDRLVRGSQREVPLCKQPGLTATGTHVPYRITRCSIYLPPGRSDIPTLTPAENTYTHTHLTALCPGLPG